MSSKVKKFSRGIIEGFFGRQCSWQTRQAFASFLKQNNYQYYIYAPKADRYQPFQTPYSKEIVDWLQGKYPFDPACLTD